MDNPSGAVIFNTVGRPQYGFDTFSVSIDDNNFPTNERRLTDGISVNFNAQFAGDHQSVVFVSERTGAPRIHLSGSAKSLPSAPGSCFHDRPVVKNGRLYFISAHENPQKPFTSWSALYSAGIDGSDSVVRLTPRGSVDYSPAVSESGKFLAVASYGSRPWGGEFHELNTEIVVFKEEDPTRRVVVSGRGGWPSWSGESVVYFHRQAEDGWWSIYRVEIPQNLEVSVPPPDPIRVTPAGLHCFTPAAMHDGKRLVVATRRRNSAFRHIEIFNLGSNEFDPITERLNPDFHHYNPFVSPDSNSIGYHRFRGESALGELTVPHLEPVASPIKGLRMIRINRAFPTPSPDGDFIAFNPGFSGLRIVKSDGSKSWTVLKDRTAFYNSWSPTEKNVIYTSVGPIFEMPRTTVQIARITINYDDLNGDNEDISYEVKILTKDDTGNNAFPACSPDGKSLVFRSGRSGHKNLYVMDAVNGEFDGGIRRLTDGPWIDTMPSWSPVGDLIAFSSNMHNPNNSEAFSIYVIRPDGSGLRRIHVAGLEGSAEVDRERINHVCFSRDGEWLLFTSNLGGVTVEPVSLPNQFQPYGDLFVVRLDGTGLRRLTWSGYENGTPTWHYGSELALSAMSLKDEVAGEKLTGEFDEPLWIKFN